LLTACEQDQDGSAFLILPFSVASNFRRNVNRIASDFRNLLFIGACCSGIYTERRQLLVSPRLLPLSLVLNVIIAKTGNAGGNPRHRASCHSYTHVMANDTNINLHSDAVSGSANRRYYSEQTNG